MLGNTLRQHFSLIQSASLLKAMLEGLERCEAKYVNLVDFAFQILFGHSGVSIDQGRVTREESQGVLLVQRALLACNLLICVFRKVDSFHVLVVSREGLEEHSPRKPHTRAPVIMLNRSVDCLVFAICIIVVKDWLLVFRGLREV
mgnify:CR=1 FL=1